MDAKAEEKLIGRKAGAVAEIVFNNPAKLNAVSLEMWEKAGHLLQDYAKDPDIRVLVVSGAGGKAFVSGADISKFESERSSREAVEHYTETATLAYETLYNFPKPTIAKITGYCVGGGMNLAACCDLRFCNDRARFAIPAAKLGLGYGPTGVRRLAEIIGLARTMEFFFTARQFSAEEARQMGLVNDVLSDAMLDVAIDDVTNRISENAPLTIASIKATARELGKLETERDHEKLDALVQKCFESEDYIEGRRAFMEKRKPAFKGA